MEMSLWVRTQTGMQREIRIKRETWTIKRVYGRIGYQTF